MADSGRRKQAPAKTVEARENQMIALAVDVAEKQLRSGNASAQVITHYLKLATVREQRERALLEAELELRQAKVEQIGAGARLEELVGNAMKAFKSYAGAGDQPEGDPNDVY